MTKGVTVWRLGGDRGRVRLSKQKKQEMQEMLEMQEKTTGEDMGKDGRM